MSQATTGNGKEPAPDSPPLRRDAHRRVEEVFQWKQEDSRSSGEEVFSFARAEDRLAIGIIQALAENSNERALHGWISQLLTALDTASKANETTAEAYRLDLQGAQSVVSEAHK